MPIASSKISFDGSARAAALSGNHSAAFVKTVDRFSVYTFLDTAWEAVVGYLGQEGYEGQATTLNLSPWIELSSLAPQQRLAIERLSRGLPYSIEFTIKALGQSITLQESGFMVGVDDKGQQKIQGFLQNITAQRQALEEMERQRLFYEGTLNKMPVELVVLDKTQHYIFCNKTAIKNDELRAWLIGKTDLDYCLHRGKDPKTVALRQAYFNQAVSTKQEVEWEEVQKNEFGENDYNLKRYSPILGPDGEILIVIGYGFNISDRRRAEIRAKEQDELIRSLAENVQEGIYRLSAEGKLLFANDAFYDLMPELVAEKMRKGISTDIADRVLAMLLDAEGKESGQEVSIDLQGRSRNWLISSRRTADGMFVDGVVIDITHLKEVQADLERKNAELEKAYMELDKFVYSASHDLRAPLTSILGLVKVMETEHEQKLEDFTAALPYVGMIKTSVTRLDDFVKEIIQYYRNNRTEIHHKETDLALLTQAIYDSLSHYRPEVPLKLEVVSHLETPLTVDASRLNIILNNLIINSVKYHDKPGGFVRTTLTHQKGHLCIEVEDNGPGIQAEHHTKLFDMFYRIGFDETGSGLGLYIVQETIKKLEGTLTFESSPRKGTKFTVKLPLQQV